jgi:drug/metabolite transporter (DMT)-like permease
MPLDALALAFGSAFLHALWNLLLARERDPEAATAVALVAAVAVFAPVLALDWDADAGVWPFVTVTSLLQLTYFALLSTAYRRAEITVVYPVARGVAPVIVLVAGVVLLGTGAGAAQAGGVCLVGLGVLLLRGLGARRDVEGVVFGLAVASCIAAYTLVDARGVEHAGPLVYLELGMIPATVGYVALLLALPHGSARLRRALRPAPATAGLLSFGAYALVLAALLRASAASVAAVRETSVLIAIALAAFLGERVGATRAAGAGLVVAGVALIALD